MVDLNQLQTNAIETFNLNLKFLKKYDINLFNRITNLSYFIELGEYKERYTLEYIQEEQDFDILDIANSSYIYNKKPKQFINKAIKNINFDKSNSIMLLKDKYYNCTSKINIPLDYDPAYSGEPYLKNNMYDYTTIFNQSTLNKDKKFKYITKFIYIGTLLGTHISPIQKKIKSAVNLILEANLEIFRLSLFVTNYSELAKNSHLIFSIMDEKDELFKKLQDYSDYYFHSNYMIKYYSSNYNTKDYFDRIIEFNLDDDPYSYPYPLMLKALLNNSIKNMKKYHTIDTIKDHTILNNQKVILVAAGPSLDKDILFLKENQNNFFIVAIGSVVTKLLKNDITPDIIINAEAKKITIEQFPNELKESFYDIPFLTAHSTNETILSQFNPNNIFLYEVLSHIKETSSYVIGASVTVQALHLLYILGAKEIYLLGVDLAYDPDTGASHMNDYEKITIDIVNQKNSFMETNSYSRSTTLNIKGNFRETVVTDILFQRSINGINQLTNHYLSQGKTTKIYNLSDGAYFEHTIPTKTEDVNLQVLKKIDINHYLYNNSSKGFNTEEKEKINDSIKFIDKILLELKKIESLKVKKYHEFLLQREPLFLIIFQESIKYKDFFLNRLLSNYVIISEPYLEYNFNQEIKNEENLLKKIKKIWLSHIKIICIEYKKLVSE